MGCTGSKFKGQGQRLGSSNAPSQSHRTTTTNVTRPPQSRAPMQTLAVPSPARTQNRIGGGGGGADAAKRAAAAAAAADQRMKASSSRGTTVTNGNQGELAKELDKRRRGLSTDAPELPDRVVWD